MSGARVFSPEQVDAYVPDSDAEQARSRSRQALLNGVVSVLDEEVARLRNE